MSPVLFIIYIDNLLLKLRKSCLGCYIGTEFCGAFGYADDLILLAPTVHSLNQMLNICADYALEYKVLFNPTKSKLIVCGPTGATIKTPEIKFMGGTIDATSYDKHLGNYIGNISQQDIIAHMTNDFRSRVNMVKTHFKWLPVDTIYTLFKAHCMPLYGCQLIDISLVGTISSFYVAWRKSIRYLLNIPRTTHCSLLHLICDDVPIHIQMCRRNLKFVKSLIHSSNEVTRYCARFALNGSRSPVSNSITYACNIIKCSRHSLVSKSDANVFANDSLDDKVKASVIRDLLSMKHSKLLSDKGILSMDEIEFALRELCTF
jgi:hypothetical protein